MQIFKQSYHKFSESYHVNAYENKPPPYEAPFLPLQFWFSAQILAFLAARHK